MTGLSFLRALLCAKARQQRDLRRVLDDRDRLGVDLQTARAGWDEALDMAAASTDLVQELTAERDQLLAALRATAADQRKSAALNLNLADERQVVARRKHLHAATILDMLIEFGEGNREVLDALLPIEEGGEKR